LRIQNSSPISGSKIKIKLTRKEEEHTNMDVWIGGGRPSTTLPIQDTAVMDPSPRTASAPTARQLATPRHGHARLPSHSGRRRGLLLGFIALVAVDSP